MVKEMRRNSLNTFCSDLINPVHWNSDTIFSAFRGVQDLLTAMDRLGDVSKSEQDIFNLLPTRLMVSNSSKLPFSIVDGKKHNQICSISQLFKFIRPSTMVPSSSTIKKKLLPHYHDLVKARVIQEIKNALAEGFATLMFDSSEDVNNSPVTHFLFRVMVGPRHSIKTFFLSSVYSVTNKTNAKYYRERAFEVI